MTGTGTQADPFVVDAWPDFVTAAETSGAYVAFPEGGGTIDMNGVAPESIAQVQLRCASIEGNGWNIRNLYVSGHGAFYLRSNVIINSLSITDFYGDFQSEGARFFDNDDNNHQYTFNLCAFSGVLTGTHDRAGLFVASYVYSKIRLHRCAINVKLDGNTKLIYSGGASNTAANMADFCNIQVSGTSVNSLADKYNYRNCYFSGKCLSKVELYSDSDFNVFNVDFTEAEGFTCYCANPDAINIINTDILPSGVTGGTGFAGVTEAQMLDANYLAALGFPIGVVIND